MIRISQRNRLTALMRRQWITPLDALQKAGSMRLGARVFELRRLGVTIREKWVKVNGRTRCKAFRIA